MTFQYASDLHLEFPENYDYLKKFPIKPKADILILAGDIVTFSQLEKRMDFFNYVSDNFEQVYWIPGNHEYYYADIARCSGPHQEQIKNNVELVNNITIKATDYDLIFSTMWSHITPPNERQIFDGMSDFYVIRNNGQVFRPTDYNKLHKESLDFIQSEISIENGRQKVVVTHHVPTLMNYPAKFLGSVLNEAFAVELKQVIEKHSPLCWIYGHHHQNIIPFKIGQTTMLTNQLGYVRSGEHTNFCSEKLFDPKSGI